MSGDDARVESAVTTPTPLRFVPSRVEGWPAITEVAIYPDRFELNSAGRWTSVRYWNIAQWPRPRWFWQALARLGRKPRWLPIGGRDWCREPTERYFRFFTAPRLVVYMPAEEPNTMYGETLFRRIQDVIAAGGYSTWDLG